METPLRQVHIGREIKTRVEALEISKSEFGRRIGVAQQHINRIFEKETIDTGRLARISEALDFNFFELYCSPHGNINAYLAAVALGGNAENTIGDAVLAAENKFLKEKIESLEEGRKQLKSQLEDKDAIIALLQGNK